MYYLVYGFLYLFSLLPLWLLHAISDGFYLVVYYVIGYRKKVVMYNLSIAFPEKSPEEKTKIAKQFYKNFTDTFVESIKLISAGNNFLKKHFNGDMNIFYELHKQGKKCQVHLGHNFNWELANVAMPLLSPYIMLIVYMPIHNKIFSRIFKKIRSKTGSVLLPANEMSTAFSPYRDQQYLLALVADQNPGNPSKSYWLNFFGRPTPFVKGPEKGAKANNAAVIFCHFTKPRRGYYEAHFELATSDPVTLPDAELTKTYGKYLEKVISTFPHMWLWSHRRWRHEWKEEYGPVL